MGVHGLWELLSPVGRRVSVDTLAGKKLAIDASIWMVQFMKAMRDEKGEMVRNAHILGFFRRICKLLFLRTKPVFVFDGATPALKRRTVIARRRQRENAKAKIRKTAEKLLLNHLKTMRLKELAKDLESQRQKNDAKGKKVITDEGDFSSNKTDENHSNQEELDKMLAASLAAVAKGKNICTDQEDFACNDAGGSSHVSLNYNQEKLDEMLAASLVAEEDEHFPGNASISSAGILAEGEDEDDDEEMMLPTMNGTIDPAVLAALPPSMQLDLLVQMRERLMAENRQKYQKVKKAPAKFSELQIQSYLKTVAFRREIGEVQKSAAGKGVGGVQTSRIASEANREFIFSSSFTGDKEVLTSAGVEKDSGKPRQTLSTVSESMNKVASADPSASETVAVEDDSSRFDDSIETYLDERGRVRVSRVRAMGIRMTRDLQRNLELMKEVDDLDRENSGIADCDGILGKNASDNSRFTDKDEPAQSLYQDVDELLPLNDNRKSMPGSANLIEISFQDDGSPSSLDGDDKLFADLVAGNPVLVSKADDSAINKQYSHSDSDFDWEEVGGDKSDINHPNKKESDLFLSEGDNNIESEVEWEDGDVDVPTNASGSVDKLSEEPASKGALEEEAQLHEAIRRSLSDFSGPKSTNASVEDGEGEEKSLTAHGEVSPGSDHEENGKAKSGVHPLNDVLDRDQSLYAAVDEIERTYNDSSKLLLNTGDDSGKGCMVSSMAPNPHKMEGLTEKPHETYHKSQSEPFCHGTSAAGDVHMATECQALQTCDGKSGDRLNKDQLLDTPSVSVELLKLADSSGGKRGDQLIVDQLLDTPSVNSELMKFADSSAGVAQISDAVSSELPHVFPTDAQEVHQAAGNTEKTEHCTGQKSTDIHGEEKVFHDTDRSIAEDKDESTSNYEVNVPTEVGEASLEEEMLDLSQERIDLGHEQRKLERNAESVSGEMFAECQELLQMFGLPYIIAPMEAEAQCAYMELTNLVDGVVTDDSDVFLFGARSVYKNIFDERKYVETYFMKDIEKELGLSREKLIRMAMLLGSDYTEGVSGIGIVNAIEVVNAFPEEDGLKKFREWIESPDPTILGNIDVRTESTPRKKGPRISSSAEEQLASSDTDKTKQVFMDKHRNVSKNWHIPSTFPSEAVINAYISPQVDKSTDPFSWGKPDLFVLRKLCWDKFAWNTQKADELLQPVLKEYNKHETQLRLEAFYTFNERFAKVRSKRINKALKGITGNRSSELDEDFVQEAPKSAKKRTANSSKHVGDTSELPSETDNSVKVDCNSMQKSTKKYSRKMKQAEAEPSESGNSEQLQVSRGKSNRGRSGRAGRGRGRGQAVGRGKRKRDTDIGHSGSGSDETSFSDSNGQIENIERRDGVRKSNRARKSVKYTLDDSENDDLGKEDNTHKEAMQEDLRDDRDLVTNLAVGSLEKNQHKIRSPSRSPRSREDNLKVSGGFCEDEPEAELEEDQPRSTQNEGVSAPVEINQHKLGAASPIEFSREEYLKMGGGFCEDEPEPELEVEAGQNGDLFTEADFSKEYINMGGGFCMDEDESNMNNDKNDASPARVSNFASASSTSHYFNTALGADLDVHPAILVSSSRNSPDKVQAGQKREALLSDHNLPKSTSNDPLNSSVSYPKGPTKDDSSSKSLSAMPFLRRKRKKS